MQNCEFHMKLIQNTEIFRPACVWIYLVLIKLIMHCPSGIFTFHFDNVNTCAEDYAAALLTQRIQAGICGERQQLIHVFERVL